MYFSPKKNDSQIKIYNNLNTENVHERYLIASAEANKLYIADQKSNRRY